MPSMIYTANNQYAIVEDTDVAAFVAGGWFATPQGDIYTEPTKYTGDMTIPVPLPDKKKTATPKPQE